MNVINPLSDWGRWHHEVDRFVNGEIPYKDFTWQYPPLSIYMLGTIAIVFGSNYLTMRICTVILCGVITLLTWLITRKTLYKYINSDIIVLLICLGSLLSGYTTLIVYTMSSGDYTPAVPFGIMFTLLLLYGIINLLEKQSNFYFILSGIAAAGCLLTKQEFWLFPLFIGIFMTLILFLRKKSNKKGIFLYWLIGLGLTLLFYNMIIGEAGFENLLMGLSGFSDLRVVGRLMPSVRLMFDQIVMSSFYILLFTIIFYFFGSCSDKKIIRKIKLVALISLLIGVLTLSTIILQTYRVAESVAISDDLEAGNVVTLSSWGFLTLKSGINIIADWDLLPSSTELIRATVGSVFLNTVIKHLIPGVSLMICALIYLLFLAKNSRKTNISIMLTTFAIAIFTLQMRRLFERTAASFYFIVPIFVFLLIINFTSKIKFNQRRFILVLAITWFLIGCLFFSIKTIAPRMIYPQYELNTVKGKITVFSGDNIQPVLDIINSMTKPEDYLLPIPYDSGLNYMTNLRNPVKVTQFYFFSLPKQEELEMVRDIDQKKPLIVINEKMSVNAEFPQPVLLDIFRWEPKRHVVAWREVYPDLWEFINTNYDCNEELYPNWSFCTPNK